MKLSEVSKEFSSGYGYGYGYGYGSGYGDGSGYGYGYGDGSGYGYGYGYGYGDGSRTDFLKAILDSHQRPPLIVGFWRSLKDGRPANGGGGESRKVGQVEEIQGPLEICTARGLHATLDPDKWKGERWWIVGLHEPVQREGDKMASLKREIIADLGIYPFDT